MTQIEVTLLGTTSGVPTPKRNHPAIHISYRSENEFNYLFDCGEGTQRQIFSTEINFMRINEIFITHWHADHFAGLLGLLQTMNLEGRQKPLTIFAPEAERFVPMLFEVGYNTIGFKIIPKDVDYEESVTSKVFETNEFEIISIPVSHGIPAVAYAFVEKDRIKIDKDKAEALGLPKKGIIYKNLKEKGHVVFKGKKIMLNELSIVEKGKKVVYSGDTKPCSNMEKISEGADLLIHDTTYFEDMERRHSTLNNVLKLVEQCAVKKTVLTHISRRYQNPKELQDMIKDYPNIAIARDLMKVVLG